MARTLKEKKASACSEPSACAHTGLGAQRAQGSCEEGILVNPIDEETEACRMAVTFLDHPEQVVEMGLVSRALTTGPPSLSPRGP